MTRRLLAVGLVIALALPACAADREFKAAVKAIEQQYGIRKTRIPFLGVTMFFLRAAGTRGVAGMKLAIFEDLPGLVDPASASLEQVLEKSLDENWRPFVRTYSRRQNERTLIYAKPDGRRMTLLIVAQEPSQASVIQLKLKASDVRKWMSEPEKMAERQSNR